MLPRVGVHLIVAELLQNAHPLVSSALGIFSGVNRPEAVALGHFDETAVLPIGRSSSPEESCACEQDEPFASVALVEIGFPRRFQSWDPPLRVYVPIVLGYLPGSAALPPSFDQSSARYADQPLSL